MSETPHVPPPGGVYTPPPPAGGTTGGSRDTAMLVLSYLWFLSIIPLVAKKEDREVQWHAKNGLILAIAYTAIEIVFWAISHCFTYRAINWCIPWNSRSTRRWELLEGSLRSRL